MYSSSLDCLCCGKYLVGLKVIRTQFGMICSRKCYDEYFGLMPEVKSNEHEEIQKAVADRFDMIRERVK